MLLRMYTRWAEAHGYKVEWLEESDGEDAGIKSATMHGQGPQRLWLAEDRERRASPGAHLALRLQRAPPHVASPASGSIRWSTTASRSRSTRTTCAPTPIALRRRRRPARQQDRLRGAPHPHPDRHRRRLPAGALAAQEPRHGLGHAARPALRGGAEEARGRRPTPIRPPRPISAGATRSAPTCCSPIRW